MIAGLEALKQMQEKMHSKTDSKFAAMQISTRKK